MSSPRYDFVGIASKQLPYVHDSFPAGSKLPGTVRYYTMRSIHKGKGNDTDNSVKFHHDHLFKSDDTAITNIRFPKMAFESKEPANRKMFEPSQNSGNIYRQKAYFRLKGIPMNQVYSLHRTKSKKLELNGHGKTANDVENRGAGSLSSLELTFPHIRSSDKAFSEGNIETDSLQTEDSDFPFKKSRLQEMDRESPIPGIMPQRKGRPGRKLGNIVSSRRLQQLLDNEETLDPVTFYYY